MHSVQFDFFPCVCVGREDFVLNSLSVSKNLLTYFKVRTCKDPDNNGLIQEGRGNTSDLLVSVYRSAFALVATVWGKPSLDQNALEVFLRHICWETLS